MPYTPVGPFANNAAPAIDAAFLNGVETFLEKTPDSDDAAASEVPVWSGSAWTYKKVTNTEVDAAAAIAYSKLALAASIVNGDISASAAIAYSKLALTGKLVDADAATGTNLHKLAAVTGSADGTKFLRDDGAWASAGTTELAYVEGTAAVSVSAATTVVTSGAITYDGSAVILTFYAPAISLSSANNATLNLSLYDDTTDLGILYKGVATGGGTAVTQSGVFIQRKFTPSAGSHTYLIHGSQINGTQTIQAGAGGASTYMPLFLRIVKA